MVKKYGYKVLTALLDVIGIGGIPDDLVGWSTYLRVLENEIFQWFILLVGVYMTLSLMEQGIRFRVSLLGPRLQAWVRQEVGNAREPTEDEKWADRLIGIIVDVHRSVDLAGKASTSDLGYLTDKFEEREIKFYYPADSSDREFLDNLNLAKRYLEDRDIGMVKRVVEEANPYIHEAETE